MKKCVSESINTYITTAVDTTSVRWAKTSEPAVLFAFDDYNFFYRGPYQLGLCHAGLCLIIMIKYTDYKKNIWMPNVPNVKKLQF